MGNSTNIQQRISNHLEDHQVVFWHDPEAQFQLEYGLLDINDCVKHQLGNGDFQFKNQIYSASKSDKFLIYHAGPLPKDEENYLLDVILSCKNFMADKISDLLTEFNLNDEYRSLLEENTNFFKSKERIKRITGFLPQIDDKKEFGFAMLASVLKVGMDDFDIVLQGLISGYHNDGKWEELLRLGLESKYLSLLRLYLSFAGPDSTPSEHIKFIFQQYDKDSIRLFLDRWRRDLNYQEEYITISNEIFDRVFLPRLSDFGVSIWNTDLFKEIDRSLLLTKYKPNIESGGDIAKVLESIKARKSTYWYPKYSNTYNALEAACQFFLAIQSFTLQSDLERLVENYAKSDFKIDQYYRKYYYYKRSVELNNDFEVLDNRIDSYYENDFLERINIAYCKAIASSKPDLVTLTNQDQFFISYVSPLIEKGNKVAVLISDAFRYEIGHEFVTSLNSENRFNATIDYGLSLSPSFTQLGMSALLPHSEIELNVDATCRVDGVVTNSLLNREKLLKVVNNDSKCLEVRQFRDLNTSAIRDLLKDVTLVYIYSNVVDKVGDTRLTERDTFQSVHDEQNNLKDIVKKIASSNFTNIMITADHGFIYRSKPIDEGQKIISDDKTNFLYKNRRFAFAEESIDDNRLIGFKPNELSCKHDHHIVFPNALNVFKVSGAGMQFLHGGLSIQEMVIPFIKIRKERKEVFDAKSVDVEVLSFPRRISGYQTIVNVLQRDAVGDKVLPKHCKIGFYSEEEVSLSEQKEVVFDNKDTEIRNREQKLVFSLASEIYNYQNKKISFIIYEKDEKFNHYTPYLKREIQVFISEEKDFDI